MKKDRLDFAVIRLLCFLGVLAIFWQVAIGNINKDFGAFLIGATLVIGVTFSCLANGKK